MKKKLIILSIMSIFLYYMFGLFFIQAKISKNINYEGLELFPAKKLFRWGYIDQSGNVIIKPNKLQVAHEFSEDLAVTYKNNLAGYINKKGEIAINPQFIYAERFSEGLAVIAIGESQWDMKYGYIDPKGNIVIEPIYDDAKEFSEGLAAVSKDGKYGYIDKSGNAKIEPHFNFVLSFNEGLAVVRVDEEIKYGYIDKTGQIIIEPKFDSARDFSEGLAPVFNHQRGWGYINIYGEFVLEQEYGSATIYSEDYAVMTTLDGKYIIRDKYLNVTNEVEHSYKIMSVREFKDGMAAVGVSESGSYIEKWGFIDKTGKMVIEPIYDQVSNFNNGIAKVIIGRGEYFRKEGYIDKTGRYVWKPTY